jgi:hypothetical protein
VIPKLVLERATSWNQCIVYETPHVDVRVECVQLTGNNMSGYSALLPTYSRGSLALENGIRSLFAVRVTSYTHIIRSVESQRFSSNNLIIKRDGWIWDNVAIDHVLY